MFFSASTLNCYAKEIHGESIPADAVEITDEQFAEVLDAREAGKIIAADGNGYPIFLDPPPPTIEQMVEKYREAIQKHLDDAARAAGYDDIRTAVTYADEPAVAKFQAEGQAFRAWRSLVWAYGYEQVDAVTAGEREQPTIDELISELPALVLP